MTARRSASSEEETLRKLHEQLPGYKISKSEPITPTDRVVVWLISSVLAALVPVAISWIHVVGDERQTVSFSVIFGDGELFIISVVLMIAGLGEMLLHLKDIKLRKRWLALFTLACVLMVATASLAYGIVTESEPGTKDALSRLDVAWGSLSLFVLAAILTSGCVWLAADAEVED